MSITLRTLIGGLILIFLIGASGCAVEQSDVQRALAQLDQLLQIIDDQSKSWQETLKNLEDKAAKDIQSTITVEVNNTIQRGIAATGTEFRCNADFLRSRVKQHLLNIKTALLMKAGLPHKETIPIIPAFCSVVPSEVDLRIGSERLDTVKFFGYDMDFSEPSKVKVFLVDNTGLQSDVSDKVTNPTHYLMTLNVSPGSGVRFQPNSDKLVLRWGNSLLSSIGIVRDRAPFKAEVSVNAVGPSDAPTVSATAPEGTRLIGGGCHSEWQGPGQLLTASYPSGKSWVCVAKAHAVMDLAVLTAYVVYVPTSLNVEIDVATGSGGPPSDQQNAKAPVRAGFSVIGGGCQTSWKKPEPGSLLVNSYPVSDGWICSSKAHSVSSPASLTSYVIGVRSPDFTVGAGEPITGPSRTNVRNTSSSTLPSGQGLGLVGGGCKINYGGAGQLLTATYPDLAHNQWMCDSKDHQVSDPSTVTAYSLGLKPNRF